MLADSLANGSKESIQDTFVCGEVAPLPHESASKVPPLPCDPCVVQFALTRDHKEITEYRNSLKPTCCAHLSLIAVDDLALSIGVRGDVGHIHVALQYLTLSSLFFSGGICSSPRTVEGLLAFSRSEISLRRKG